MKLKVSDWQMTRTMLPLEHFPHDSWTIDSIFQEQHTYRDQQETQGLGTRLGTRSYCTTKLDPLYSGQTYYHVIFGNELGEVDQPRKSSAGTLWGKPTCSYLPIEMIFVSIIGSLYWLSQLIPTERRVQQLTSQHGTKDRKLGNFVFDAGLIQFLYDTPEKMSEYPILDTNNLT